MHPILFLRVQVVIMPRKKRFDSWTELKKIRERMGATFDGASINRKLVCLHSKNDDLISKILNPCSIEARPFYFFFDPPHLIKTTRNCWASKARNLWVIL